MEKEKVNLDAVEKNIIHILSNEGTQTSEELSIKINMDQMELLGKLSLMDVEGKVSVQGSRVKLP